MLKSGRSVFSRRRKGDKSVSLKIPSRIEYIRKVSDSVLRSLAGHHIDEDKAFDIKLCVEEAVRNAIVHGNKSDKRRSVKVVLQVSGDEAVIDVEDEGRGFDHARVADPTTDANIARNCGRGLFLIKKLMDKVEYIGSGNKVRMTKRIK
jgi:serine/threonine-protein kinase RsbW